jgi:hypothetical protein
MSACAQCGTTGLVAEGGLCASHHYVPEGDDWAAVNRALCGLIHRRQPLPHVSLVEPAAEPSWA